MRYTKVNGLGNDFVVIDADDLAADPSALARAVCDRRTGVGADGLLIVETSPAESDAAAALLIFNSDGSTAEMCGNGIRCVARLLVERGAAPADRPFSIATPAGLRWCEIVGRPAAGAWLVRVSMGVPTFGPDATRGLGLPERGPWEVGGERVWLVDVGNPHAVVFVDRPIVGAELERRGRAVEHDSRFPARLNAQFVVVESRSRLRVRTWERGAGATSACGTGACAALAAAVRARLLERTAEVLLPGGALRIEWPADEGELLMTGPAEVEFEGEWAG